MVTQMQNTINLTYLYPDILCLHGDRGNVWTFQRVAKMLGINLNVTRVDTLSDEIDFENSDIMLMSPGELRSAPQIISRLSKDKDSLLRYIEQNKYFITIGTSGAMFTNKIIYTGGNTMNALGIIDGIAKERVAPYGDDILFSCDLNGKQHNLSGIQIQMFDLELNHKHSSPSASGGNSSFSKNPSPFGEAVYGYGNCKDKDEGYKVNNFIFTNALGPLFVKNPWLAESILRDIANKKNIAIDDTLSCDFSLEQISYDSIKEFVDNKEKPL